MTLRISHLLPTLALIAAGAPLFAADGDAAPAPAPAPAPAATSVADLEARIADLDQQVRILARNSEVAKENADAADAKAKAAVKDGDLVVKVKGYIQGRATLGADAHTTRGDNEDFYSGNATASDESENARFSLRRVRLGIEARSRNDSYAVVNIRADNVGTSGSGVLTTNAAGATSNTGSISNSPVQLYQAFVGKAFTVGDFVHDVKFGLDKIYNNDSSISSTAGLLAGDRSGATLLSSQREIGFAYQFRAPFLRAGFDLQNAANLNRVGVVAPGANRGNYDHAPSLAYSFRIEGAPGADYLPAKKQESYIGAYGTQALFGFDFQNSGNTYAVANEERDLTIFGPDVLFHHDRWTFLAEYRWSQLNSSATNGQLVPRAALDGTHWDAQVGYAVPLDAGFVIEPALRFEIDNWDTEVSETSNWGVNASRDNNVIAPTGLLATGGLTPAALSSGATNLGSGRQIDVGVNFYWNGNYNKTQVGYTYWAAESGDSTASAFTVQQQLVW